MKESDARLFNQGRIVWRQLKRKLIGRIASAERDELPINFSIHNFKPRRTGGANRGWVASRSPDSEIGHSRVFHCAGRACVHAVEHRHRPAAGLAECVGGGISNLRAQDRQPAAIRNWSRNFRGLKLPEGRSREARREWFPRKRLRDARFHPHPWRFFSRFPANDCACQPQQKYAMSLSVFPGLSYRAKARAKALPKTAPTRIRLACSFKLRSERFSRTERGTISYG